MTFITILSDFSDHFVIDKNIYLMIFFILVSLFHGYMTLLTIYIMTFLTIFGWPYWPLS
jgi:hypothetical protein